MSKPTLFVFSWLLLCGRNNVDAFITPSLSPPLCPYYLSTRRSSILISSRFSSLISSKHHHHHHHHHRHHQLKQLQLPCSSSQLYALATPEEQQQPQQQTKKIRASSLEEKKSILDNNNDKEDNVDENKSANDDDDATAIAGTINERLMVELEEAANKEKYGSKSSSKNYSLGGLRQKKTPEEIEASIAEARNLNGVNPIIALVGGIFAFSVAALLWYTTNTIAAFFTLHPVETDIYFVQRLAAVFRNVIIGLISLASGFFGVTGMGIFLLGIRVAIGVAKGELDPTPIKKKKNNPKDDDILEMPNVWDLMMNKKPTRRGGRTSGKNDNNNNNNNNNNRFGL